MRRKRVEWISLSILVNRQFIQRCSRIESPLEAGALGEQGPVRVEGAELGPVRVEGAELGRPGRVDFRGARVEGVGLFMGVFQVEGLW